MQYTPDSQDPFEEAQEVIAQKASAKPPTAKFGPVVGGVFFLVVLLLLFGYCVWPTPWHVWKGNYGVMHRVPRSGGIEEEEIGGGWYPASVIEPENKGKKTLER